MSVRQPTPLVKFLNDAKLLVSNLTKQDYSTLVVNSAIILPTVVSDEPTPPAQESTETVKPKPPPDLP